MKPIALTTYLILFPLLVWASTSRAAELSGELKQWHKVTLTFDGPDASETGSPNPFLDHNLTVTFTHQSGRSYGVPGYFAADGNAAITSATGGNKWRVHLTPDAVGQWEWKVSFRQGAHVAVDADAASTPWAPLDGQSGSFMVEATDKGGRDFRGKGYLQYVGERYLRFAGTGDYFLKGGANSPEDFLGYVGFDETPVGHKTGVQQNRNGTGRSWSVANSPLVTRMSGLDIEFTSSVLYDASAPRSMRRKSEWRCTGLGRESSR